MLEQPNALSLGIPIYGSSCHPKCMHTRSVFSSLVLVKCKATSLVKKKKNGKKQRVGIWDRLQLMDYPTEGNPIPCLQIRQY